MKHRMLSLLSIILALSIKSLEISAKDYNELRAFMRAIPADQYAPHLMPYALENKLDSVVYQLALSNTVRDFQVDVADTSSTEFYGFKDLQTVATEKDLNSLLAHPSPVVKVYAYRALVVNNMNMNCDLELALLEDTACVDWSSNDEINETTVKDLIQKDLLEFKY